MYQLHVSAITLAIRLYLTYRVAVLHNQFMYLTIVNEISSPIEYTDYIVQLLCKISTT